MVPKALTGSVAEGKTKEIEELGLRPLTLFFTWTCSSYAKD